MSKLPSTYRAEHEAILRQIYSLLGEVKGAVNCGKGGIRCDDLLRSLSQIVEDAGAEQPFDIQPVIDKAAANCQTKKEKPALRAVK